jgi:hypothetical protein
MFQPIGLDCLGWSSFPIGQLRDSLARMTRDRSSVAIRDLFPALNGETSLLPRAGKLSFSESEKYNTILNLACQLLLLGFAALGEIRGSGQAGYAVGDQTDTSTVR